MSEARAQRAAALEERKRRLEEMRNRRSRRTDETSQRSNNLDEYIDGLLSQPAAPGAAPAVSPSASVEKTSTVPEAASIASASLQSNVIAEPAPAPEAAPPIPRTVETFTIATQTDPTDFPEDPEKEDQVEEETPVESKAPEEAVEATETAPEDLTPKLLSSEQVEQEVVSRPFSSFINTASKKVERFLGNPVDLDFLGDEVPVATSDVEQQYVSSRQVYVCDKWTQGRDITDLHWNRDYLLSTYGACSTEAATLAPPSREALSSSLTPRSGELQSDGLAMVWNVSLPNRPEHILTCASPVTAGRLHPSEASLVLGACESGQVVVWDVRAGRLPVQKSSKGHVHPVCCMDLLGVRLAC